MINKSQLKAAATASHLPSGVDLMRRITDGTAKKVSSEYIAKVREQVIEGCDELIEVGARIRPLMSDGQQIGWVRGMFGTERKRLSRWVKNPYEFIVTVLTYATTLTKAEIEELSSSEVRNMVELIQRMTEYDASLYPYLSAFVSSLTSENLWHSRGTALTSFENRVIMLPDGRSLTLLVPSDHARLWASLCVYREQTKARLEANWNSVLQIRPMAGKSADPLISELKNMSRHLATNSMEPWEDVVKVKEGIDLDDGWAHAENLDTREGMLKELHGMLNNDRHEQLMAKFEKQQIDAADKRKRDLEAVLQRRGGPGVYDEEPIKVFTEEELQQRERDLRAGRTPVTPVDRAKSEVTPNPVERMKRYQ